MAVADLFNRNRDVLAFAAGIAAAVLLSGFLVFGPKVREIRRLEKEVAVRQDEMGESLRLWGEMAREKGGKSRVWEERVLRFDERVPAGADTERFMAEIGRQAVKHNLRAFRLASDDGEGAGRSAVVEGPGSASGGTGAAPGAAPPDGEKPYAEMKYRVTFLSGYKEMAQFVDELPAMRRLVSLRRLSIGEKEGEMETTLEISVYKRVGK